MITAVPGLLRRTLGLTLLWWVLAEGSNAYWAYGLPTIVGCVAVSVRLRPLGPTGDGLPRRVVALARLTGWYLWFAVRGALDVARRALRRPVDIDPVVIPVRVRLPEGLARQVAVGMCNLMPGTLVQGLAGETAYIHALDAAMPVRAQWADLEERVAAAAGRSLAN